MRFPSPTSLRTAVALVASATATLAGCRSFITGIPDVDRVEVTIAPQVINVNQTATATGVPYNGRGVVTNDRRRVTFRSSNPEVATVNPTNGLIIGLTPGVSIITGESDGKTDTASVIVRLVPVRTVLITNPNPRYRVGATNLISAVPRDSANNVIGNRQVLYRSTNEAVLTVENGIVTPRAVGTADVIATVENGVGGGPAVADTVTATVTLPPITSVRVDPLQPERTVGETQQFTVALTDSLGAAATGRTVTWVSGSTTVATVNGSGLATALTPGQATISAVVDRVPGEPNQVSGGSVLVVRAPASATTTSNLTTVALQAGRSTILSVGVRDAGGNVLVGRVIRDLGYDPNIVQVGFGANFSQLTITGRAVGTTTVTLQARDVTNQQDQGTPINVQVTVSP